MTRVSEEYQTEGDDFTRLQSEETSRKPDELDEVRFKTTVEKKTNMDTLWSRLPLLAGWPILNGIKENQVAKVLVRYEIGLLLKKVEIHANIWIHREAKQWRKQLHSFPPTYI